MKFTRSSLSHANNNIIVLEPFNRLFSASPDNLFKLCSTGHFRLDDEVNHKKDAGQEIPQGNILQIC